MWTPPALASEARAWAGDLWRVVESQSRVATLKLVDTLDEQAILEAELEGSKPLIPASCVHLDTLLATPFRYAPYRAGSRFRRHRQIEGCFYASEKVETAVAEAAFHGLLFFLDAPAARRPSNPQERTAIHVPAATTAAIDLTEPPLNADAPLWAHPTDYGPCQDLADAARQAGLEAIRYRSVRDPGQGINLALLSPAAFRKSRPDRSQTWHVFLREASVQAAGNAKVHTRNPIRGLGRRSAGADPALSLTTQQVPRVVMATRPRRRERSDVHVRMPILTGNPVMPSRSRRTSVPHAQSVRMPKRKKAPTR